MASLTLFNGTEEGEVRTETWFEKDGAMFEICRRNSVQEAVRAYAAAPAEGKVYAGNLPNPAATNNQRNLTCYECGNQGHYRSDCPELKNRNHRNQVGDRLDLFKVLAKVGAVAYRLELPQELRRVHHTFYVSNLKKCHVDKPLVIPFDGLHTDNKLHFIEENTEIMDREVKRLKPSSPKGEKEKNDDVNVEKTNDIVKEKEVADVSGSQEIRKEHKQTPIHLPIRSPRNVSSSNKTISEELTATVSPTTATTSKTSSTSKCKKRSFHSKTRTLPRSIAEKIREVLQHCNTIVPELTVAKTNEIIKEEMPRLVKLAVDKDREVSPVDISDMVSKEFAANVEKTDEIVMEKEVVDVSGSQEIRKEQKQTPIPLPIRSPRNVSSSNKTISEELTTTVSPTTATTSKTSSTSKCKKRSFHSKTRTLPGSIAGMCRRRRQIRSHIKNKFITQEWVMDL
ncbi:retrovirus-related pol polyprotein from transposon TNT 1-94 [Tanacetum coccineum]